MSENNENKRTYVIDEILDWAETLILYCFVAILLLSFVVKQVIVDGDSMLPSLNDGERLIVTNFFYKPKCGDIVIFNNNNPRLEKTLVKRVIATEGQKVKIDFTEGVVYVDGKEIDEPYVNTATNLREDFYYEEVTVPEGHIFVLGDNRNNSTDSRSSFVGFVSEDCIIGKAVFRIYPFKFFK